MKFLHILNELNPSGAEVMLFSAGPLLKEYGIRGEILSTGPKVGCYAKQLIESGYIIRHLPFEKTPNFLLALFRLLRSNNYDVVHLHTEKANFWFCILALMTTKRCVRTIHSNFQFVGFLGWKRKWQRQFLHWVGVRYIAISQSVHDTEAKYYRLPTQIIPNWYNSLKFRRTTDAQRLLTRQSLNIQEKCFVLVSIGNCAPVKNHSALIEALGLLNRKDILYLHIGIEKDEGEGEGERDLAKKLGVENFIHFEGMQADVLPYLSAADLFVMPSLYEGFSIAALEAIATGLPVLLSRVSGLSDFESFFDGIYYCEPSAKSVYEALVKIINEPIYDLKSKTSNNPDKADQLFGMLRGVDAYVKIYKECH